MEDTLEQPDLKAGCVCCRSQRKAWHVALQSTAALLTILAVVAAFKSHTLKKPAPMPNLYSTHSYLGMMVLVLFGLQVQKLLAAKAV